MPRFHYNATDADGKPVSGEIDAADVRTVSAQLEADGMRVEAVKLVTDSSPAKPLPADPQADPRVRMAQTLRPGDFDHLSGHLADITASGLPLVAGLSAMAAELPRSRFGRGLRSIIRHLEAGGELAAVLKDHGAPADLRALIAAGVRSGQTGELLGRYAAESRRMADIKRRTVLAMTYPLIVLVLMATLMVFILAFIVPGFVKIFQDFGTDLPFMTVIVIEVSHVLVNHGVWLFGGLVLLGSVAVSIYLFAFDRLTRRQWICMIPIVGGLLKYGALARFSHLLAILVENGVPLPAALTLAGEGAGDAELQAAGWLIAADVEAGEPLDRAAYNTASVPSMLVEAMTWHKQPDVFADALRALSEMYEARAFAQTGLIAAVWQPVVLIVSGSVLGFTVIALFMPLVKLLNDLS